MNRHQQRVRLTQNAKDHFLRAAAAMTTGDPQSLAMALIEGAQGLYAVRELDEDLRAHDAVLKFIEHRVSQEAQV